MLTLADVYKVIASANTTSSARGGMPEELRTTFREITNRLEEAVRAENGGITKEKAASLPRTTKLGNTAFPIAQELKDLLIQHNYINKDGGPTAEPPAADFEAIFGRV